MGVITGCKLFNFFNKIIGLENTQSLKSDIRYYQRTFKIIDAPPEKCIFVGNSINEINLPKSLGARTIGISREMSSEKLFEKDIAQKADLILPNLNNLLSELIQKGILSLRKDY